MEIRKYHADAFIELRQRDFREVFEKSKSVGMGRESPNFLIFHSRVICEVFRMRALICDFSSNFVVSERYMIVSLASGFEIQRIYPESLLCLRIWTASSLDYK